MADPTAITVQALKAPFDAVVANDRDITFTALTLTWGEAFTCTGREVILVKNGTGTNTVQFIASDDEKNRGLATEDLTYSLAASDFAVFGFGLTNERGWKGASSPIVGKIKMIPSSVQVTCAVVRLPAGYGR